MDRKREEEIRRRSGKPQEQDLAQAERDIDAARNPVGNGQGDAQADNPKNEMNSPSGSGKGDRPGSGGGDGSHRRQKTAKS